MSKVKDNNLVLIETEMIKFPTGQMYETDSTAGLVVTGTYTISADQIKGVEVNDSDKADGLPLRYNAALGQLIYWDGTSGIVIDRGVIGGGNAPQGVSTTDIIQFIDINNTGNSESFGDLTEAMYEIASTSNGTNNRGFFTGGLPTHFSKNDYITINSAGNAANFGNLSGAWNFHSATSNRTNERGVIGCRHPSYTTIQYFNMSSLGDSATFGDSTVARSRAGACSNATNERGVWGGGYILGNHADNTIDYITINSLGNASDFGNLTQDKYETIAMDNSENDKGQFAGGALEAGSTSNIDVITISSTGNASHFANLVAVAYRCAGLSNGTGNRAVIAGSAFWDMEYWNMVSFVDTYNFGNLTPTGTYTYNDACSNS